MWMRIVSYISGLQSSTTVAFVLYPDRITDLYSLVFYQRYYGDVCVCGVCVCVVCVCVA